MIIDSIAKIDGQFKNVEVEVSFLPGLPQIHILGMPDRSIRENEKKIRCAIKLQGFQFPKAKQILVNLRPSGVVKSAQGLDLAIAVGILVESGQIKGPRKARERCFFKDALVYGELSLVGEIIEPEDLPELNSIFQNKILITGIDRRNSNLARPFFGRAQWRLQNLRSWGDFNKTEGVINSHKNVSVRPELPNIKWSRKYAELLQVVSLSQQHALLAGPSGFGKTTFLNAIPSLAHSPNNTDFREICERVPAAQWWPTFQPHHSLSAPAMLGGGRPFTPGILYHVHRGFLLLDELLEFRGEVLESLREPLEGREISINRFRAHGKYRSEFRLLATTNLCKCGDWVPSKERNCSYSNANCFSVRNRLTGPILDRFGILIYLDEASGALNARGRQSKDENLLSMTQILEVVERARGFLEEIKSADASDSRLHHSESAANEQFMVPEFLEIQFDGASVRRRKAVAELARIYAALDFSAEIKSCHWLKALRLGHSNFVDLKKGH